MAMTFHQSDTQDYLHLKVSGKLAKKDYQNVVPLIDRMIEKHGSLKMLIETDDF